MCYEILSKVFGIKYLSNNSFRMEQKTLKHIRTSALTIPSQIPPVTQCSTLHNNLLRVGWEGRQYI